MSPRPLTAALLLALLVSCTPAPQPVPASQPASRPIASAPVPTPTVASAPAPKFAFSLTDSRHKITRRIDNTLTLTIEGNPSEWTLAVTTPRRPDDNLLAPQKNWHGTWPFQIMPWHHSPPQAWPDARQIPIRGTDLTLHIRLRDYRIDHQNLRAPAYAAGTVEITWTRQAH